MNATEAVRELAAHLYREHGHLTASMLLDAARDPSSPAHDAFEWDDSTAAEAYRLEQSRRYLRLVKVEGRPLFHVPAFVEADHVRRLLHEEGQYRIALDIQRGTNDFEAALSALINRVQSVQKSLDEFLTTAGEARPEHQAQAETIRSRWNMFRDALTGENAPS